MEYIFKITLFTTTYDENEKAQEVALGTRRHRGTEDSAVTFARRTRTKATEARIERVAVHNGAKFQAHEIVSFGIGLD